MYKTTDGGKTWNQVLFKDAKTGAVDIAVDPNNPRILFAAMWEAYRSPWEMSSGGEGSGLYKSVDGGESWTEITQNPGMPKGLVGKIGVSVSPVNSNRVFAIVENATGGGLFRSEDQNLIHAVLQEHDIGMQMLSDGEWCEGVRALLIDKDKNPQWRFATIEEVTPDWIQAMLAPMEWTTTHPLAGKLAAKGLLHD